MRKERDFEGGNIGKYGFVLAWYGGLLGFSRRAMAASESGFPKFPPTNAEIPECSKI